MREDTFSPTGQRRDDRTGGPSIYEWCCDRCGETVEAPTKAPETCPRCERIHRAVDADVIAWVEGVVAQAMKKHDEDRWAHEAAAFARREE